jgi:hypothetical protein
VLSAIGGHEEYLGGTCPVTRLIRRWLPIVVRYTSIFDDDTVRRVPISLPRPSDFGSGGVLFNVRGRKVWRKAGNAVWTPRRGPFFELATALARLNVAFPIRTDFLLRRASGRQFRSIRTTLPGPI